MHRQGRAIAAATQYVSSMTPSRPEANMRPHGSAGFHGGLRTELSSNRVRPAHSVTWAQ
jgi:hypothetical protein